MPPERLVHGNVGVVFRVRINNLSDFTITGKAIGGTYNTLINRGFKLTGDWKDAINWFGTLDRRMTTSLDNAAREAAEYYEMAVARNWEDQALEWTPLNERYAAAKVKAGLDPRILIARGYDDGGALGTLGTRKHSPLAYEVSVTAENDETGYPYMWAHEFGRGNNPRRPLWGPTFDETMAHTAEIFNRAMRYVLKKRGGVYRAGAVTL